MAKIPLDITTDILCRQPVKALLRFRCLSKAFCSLIDGQDFIKLHLKRSISTKTNLNLILKGLNLYTLKYDDSLENPVPLNHPLNIDGETEVIGSCNGLIVLRNSEHELALYNPSTRKFKRLPVSYINPPSDCCVSGYVFYGFGHDQVNDDYKLVRMVQFKRNDVSDYWVSFEVKVYSLKTSSWRRICNLPRYLRYLFRFFYHIMYRRGFGVLVGGASHWVAPRDDGLDMIVAFDLAAEEFRELPMLDYAEGKDISDGQIHLDVANLEGCLCVICYYSFVHADVWIMKEYGVKESWTKLFSVQRPRKISGLSFSRPLAYSKNGNKVLLEVNSQKLVWFNLEKKSFWSVKIKGLDQDSSGVEFLVESLVPLNDGVGGEIHGMKQRKQEEKKRRDNKKRDDFLSKGFKLVL